MRRQQGRAKKPKGNKSRGKKKVKMSRLSYQEKKKLLDSCDPRNAEMSFQEFEEEMQDSRIDWVTESKAIQEERALCWVSKPYSLCSIKLYEKCTNH